MARSGFFNIDRFRSANALNNGPVRSTPIPAPRPTVPTTPTTGGPMTPMRTGGDMPVDLNAVTPPVRSDPIPAMTPNTASGVPTRTRQRVRQNDGNVQTVYTAPRSSGPMGARQPAPSSSGLSGLERAMHAEADRLHPQRAPRPRRSFML